MNIIKSITIMWVLGLSTLYSIDFEFTAHNIDNFRAESASFADLNKDGAIDIIGGESWYEAPDWTAHKFRDMGGSVDQNGNGYKNPDDMMEVLDVNGDGWTDIISGGFSGKLIAYINPKGGSGNWQIQTIENKDGYHNGGLWDIDGDGDTLEILSSWFEADFRWYELVQENNQWVWKRHVISNKRHNWGCGVGDINGDGRPDVVRPDAWYAAPSDPRTGQWTEHMIAIGAIDAHITGNQTPAGQMWIGQNAIGQYGHTVQIYVYDVNDDGMNDLMASSGHREGLFWYEQKRENGNISFIPHTIDSSWSQIHALEFEDMDNDGDPDLIGGKRYKAHNGGDPMWDAPLNVYWYELRPGQNPPWIRHVATLGEGIGGGNNLHVADYDGDGDKDIVAISKNGGPWLLESRLDSVTVSIETSHPQSLSLKLDPISKTGPRTGIFYPVEKGVVDVKGRVPVSDFHFEHLTEGKNHNDVNK